MTILPRILAVTVALLASVLPAHAGVLLYAEGPATASVGSEVVVQLKAKLTDSINAVKTMVRVEGAAPSVSFDDADPVIRLWLERGSSVEGGVQLEGVIPGGVGPAFSDVVNLGTLRIVPAGEGVLRVSFEDAEVYLNQPTPTLSDVTTAPLTIRVGPGAGAEEFRSPDATVLDADVRVVREPQLEDGARAVVFDIKTDRGTADVVRIRERWFGIWGSWREATSPSTLSDALGVSILDVALTGPLGEARVATIVPLLLKIIWSVVAVALGMALVRYLKQRH